MDRWERWRFYQENGRFPKKEPEQQVPHFSDDYLNERLKTYTFDPTPDGSDLPLWYSDPDTQQVKPLRPREKCEHCTARLHTKSRLITHVIERHPGKSLPEKEDGMLF